MAWFNQYRLLEPIGYIPPAEAEANYYRRLADNTVDATYLKPNSLHETRGDSVAAFVFLMEDGRPKFLQTRSRVVTEYIAGRLIGTADVRMEKDRHGRPFLPGAGLYVSISHSGPCMTLVLATEEVGVDIERIRNQATWPDLYRWINRPEECIPEPTAHEFLILLDCERVHSQDARRFRLWRTTDLRARLAFQCVVPRRGG